MYLGLSDVPRNGRKGALGTYHRSFNTSQNQRVAVVALVRDHLHFPPGKTPAHKNFRQVCQSPMNIPTSSLARASPDFLRAPGALRRSRSDNRVSTALSGRQRWTDRM